MTAFFHSLSSVEWRQFTYATFINKPRSEFVMRYLPVSTRLRSLSFALVLLLAAAVPSAFAASPMVVDDADIVGAGQCQAETWLQRWSGYSEFWVMPACNVGGKTELSLGGVRASSRARSSHAVSFQAKTLLRPLATNSWGVALTAGVIEGLNNDLRGRGWYAELPFTHSFSDDRFLLHASAGWERDPAGQSEFSWGAGSEFNLYGPNWLLAEVYDSQDGDTAFQIGFKRELISDRFELGLTFGDTLQGPNNRHVAISLLLVGDSIFGSSR